MEKNTFMFMFKFCIIFVAVALNVPHCRIPEQWGVNNIITTNIDGTLISYPIAFKTKALVVIATDGGNGCYSWGVSLSTINNFRAWARNVGAFTLATGLWFAIGV